ncbi:MAG: imidazole glycerol phosphate synthase subunit HisH [Bacteroidia bacterium]|nr:imidazole glycerol phosphate synthase subunit HisH [Bacteroidia bacterium]
MVLIINYNTGNCGSILNMIKKAGGNAEIVSDPMQLKGAEKIILPGVGSFDFGMNELEKGGWIEVLNKKIINEKVPVLGICLGMQLMAKKSEEGIKSGLGWVDAEVIKFRFEDQKIKIPHMGWNWVSPLKYDTLFKNYTDNPRFYFVHSYYVKCHHEEDIIAKTAYFTQTFVSSFRKDNIFGVQFHPEKSHVYGLHLLKNFIQL